MDFKVKCPDCEKTIKVEVDTGLADNGDVYHDVVECECGDAFMIRTTIRAETIVLAVTPPEVDRDWQWKKRVKALLGDLEKLVSQ